MLPGYARGMPHPVIIVSAVAFVREDGHVLTVRKRGTSRFMLPGGKPEPGESAAEAAVREVREEVGIRLAIDELRLLGAWEADAANEPGHTLDATVYAADLAGVPVAAAEIAELRWSDPADPLGDLAPLLRDRVIPALALSGGAEGGELAGEGGALGG